MRFHVAAVVLSAALARSGCGGSPPPSAPAPTTAPTTAQPSTSPEQPPAPAASAAPSKEASEEGSVELEVTVIAEATIGRPGPGVLSVAPDPRFTVPVLVERVDLP